MADDNTQTPNPEPEKPAAPAFDADALAAQVADRLKDQFTRHAPQPEPVRQPVPQGPADPVAELVNPYLAPVAAQAALAEQSATDAAKFYSKHKDLEQADADEVERRFQVLRQKGVPFTRDDIYAHLLGERIDKEVEKRIEKRAKAVARASEAATTVGGGSPDRSGAATVRDANSMSTADLGKALEGASF